MRNHTPSSITETVLEQMSSTPNPRLKMLMEVGIRHLHAFAREANLTPQEWLQWIEFLTRVGKTCTPARQEFILLSDVLGLSTMVNALHDATAVESATRTSLLGPFFREDSPELELGDLICRGDVAEPILLWGRVCNASGAGIANAKVMVWQTSAAGVYDLQEGDGSSIDYRGTFHTDAGGNYFLRTVRPLGYYIPLDGPVGDLIRAQRRLGKRPAHIHFLISAPGFRELVTALYFPDEYVEIDAVFGSSPDLIAREVSADPQAPMKDLPSVRFDFSLARAGSADTAGGRVGADPAAVDASTRAPATVR